MADRITANLPARDFAATSAFYGALGFAETFRDEGWMILRRGGLVLEFFPHPGVDPWSSWFSACIRIDDPDALLAEWRETSGLPADHKAIPRLTGFFKHAGAPRMFALVDPDGSLLRVIDNRDAGEVPDVG
ncbi:bleomycin resistance protein [Rhodobacter sp. SGA-6-6]|uniref:bleomycin resistance protein n=1 Tax=Rhodobacter sp. SGA-6-6 TaxID=2710882 RepID=UPI0013EA77FB|nr:bleomycin resistance protein [Rhodobacter sp. SGA-6-6]NGM46485.1 bleomycin resistance protein [Rhodobacter sp. SGA-6-6]